MTVPISMKPNPKTSYTVGDGLIDKVENYENYIRFSNIYFHLLQNLIFSPLLDGKQFNNKNNDWLYFI